MQEKITYQGKIIEVVERHFERDGSPVVHEKARRSPGTRTLITSPSGKILLTREHRHEIDGYDYRLPGGKVFDSLAEYNDFLATKPTEEDLIGAAQTGAALELYQEVGITVDPSELEMAYLSVCGATVDWDLYYFLYEADSELTENQALEAGEDIEIGWYDRDQVMSIALDDAKMQEDRTVAFLLRYLLQTR